MQKKICVSLLLLSIAGVILTAAVLTSLFYVFAGKQISHATKTNAEFLAKSLVYAHNDINYLKSLKLSGRENRVILITAAGQVVFDNYTTEPAAENHLGRPEVQKALSSGFGEYKQISPNLRQDTYYYAIKLANGNILSLTKTTHGFLSIFIDVLFPVGVVMLVVIILCHFLSLRLTKSIVEPINNIALGGDNIEAYDELSPLLSKISHQKEQIARQVRTLEKRANTIQAITEDMQEGLLLLDVKGNILSANSSAIRLLGDESKLYTDKNILELTRNKNILDHIKIALGGSASDININFGHKTVQLFFNPVIENKKPSGAIVLFLDITEKANAEKMRREFSANVSHELKTPLTSILGFSEIISSGMTKSEDIPYFAGKINTEVKRLIALIEDIGNLSELDESSGERQMEDFDLLELARSVTADLKQAATEREVTLEIKGASLPIKANKGMIGELLNNLMDNGIKNNKPGGKVAVAFAKTDGIITIKVSDTGIGIAKKHLSRVFERFYQVDKSRSKKTGGTGLGLSIVKHIAQYHNGYVDIESAEGRGTTVSVMLRG